jgi:FG-GAP repeat
MSIIEAGPKAMAHSAAMPATTRSITTLLLLGATGLSVLTAAPATSTASAATPAGWSSVPAAARRPILADLARTAAAANPRRFETADLTATDYANGDDFGYSVATSGDTIAVSEPFYTVNSVADLGAVYVFTKPASGWKNLSEAATLTVPNASDGRLGWGLAMDADTIVAGTPGEFSIGGAGGLYVFSKPAGGWKSTTTPTATLGVAVPSLDGDALGYSVAISHGTIVAGAPYWNSPGSSNYNSGHAYVYVEPTTGWANSNETAILAPSDPAPAGGFGDAVAMDGDTIAVGASQHNAAYVYTTPTGGWTDTNPYAETAELTATGHTLLGFSVGVQAKTVVVGALLPGPGAGLVYNEPSGGWASTATPNATLVTTEPAIGGLGDIGSSVAISGTTIAVGGPTATAGAANPVTGTVSVFTEPAAGWSGTVNQSDTLIAKTPSTDDALGNSVGISGTTIVAGAPGHISGADRGGAAMVFTPPAAAPRPVKPVLAKVTQTHKRWKLGSALPALNPKRKPAWAKRAGTAFSFHGNEKATVSLSIALVKGRRHVHKATLTEHASKGTNHLYFDGTITKRKKLKTGTYVVTIRAKTAAGRSAAALLTFTIT